MTTDAPILQSSSARAGRWRPVLILLCAALGLLAAAYLARGFHVLTGHGEPSDLFQRWDETANAMHGRNPYLRARTLSLYPPTAYLSLVPFVWPGRALIQLYFAGVNAIALAVMAWWAACQVREETAGPAAKWALALSVLAIGSNCTSLGVGQISIVVTALLVVTLMLAEAGHDWWAGLVFGIAMLKPTIAGLFILPLLVQKRWRPFVLASLYVLISSAIVLVWTHTSPSAVLHNLRTMADAGRLDQGTGGLLDLLKGAGVDTKLAMMLLGPIVLAATAAVLWMLRRCSLPLLFGIAAVGGRLWAYHPEYDNMMCLFLLVALGKLALENRTLLSAIAFALVGASLWIPAKVAEHHSVQLVQVFIWLAGAVVLGLAGWDQTHSQTPPYDAELQAAPAV